MTFLIAAENVAEVSDEATPEPPRKEWRPDQEAVVDPSDPEVQAAATRIQASCSNSGYLIHKSSKRFEFSPFCSQAGFKGMQARRRCDEMKRVRKITLEDVYGGADDENEEEELKGRHVCTGLG